MKKTLLLFILLTGYLGNAYAEYYISYRPPLCQGCYVSHHRVKTVRRHPCHHHRHIYRAARVRRGLSGHAFYAFDNRIVKHSPHYQTQANACCDQQLCARYPGEYVVSSAQPKVFDEYCTTYADVEHGEVNTDP